MKLFVHYENNPDSKFHKTSKITLPKKWLSGPCTNLVELFVKTYNNAFTDNHLDVGMVHLENEHGEALANECIISEFLAPSVDVYVKHGSPPARSDVSAKGVGNSTKNSDTPPSSTRSDAPLKASAPRIDTGLLQCKRFGCQKKYDPAQNHATACTYHRLPPVFHETVKFWACCPDKKCYSWDSFMQVQGCCVAEHTNVKPEQPSVLGGCDVRSGNDGSHEAQEKLKSIEEYNAERRSKAGGGGAGAGEAIAKLYQLRQAMEKAGISGELFDRAKEVISAKQNGDHSGIASEMVSQLCNCLENVANSK